MRWRRFRGNALGTVSIIPFLVMGAVSARAQPVGGTVVAGQAQVSASGATTFINQSSQKAIINWQDFSVGAGSSVQFNQPGASSITLNRVTGSNISSINGAVRANGQVWLLNPNGVLFGNDASINVGGLLATTSDIANQDFLDGRYNFSSGGRGSVINNGTIQASSGGSVVLSAPNVVNNGLIRAQAGHIVLGGTDTFTVDFTGDHLLSYAVSPNSTGGKVTNSGKISAPAGQVLLTAKAAAGVQDAVVNNTGMVEATSVREENGEIILEADDGTASSSGTLDASGKNSGETGGTVKVLGKDVAVADGAKIDVSGDAGGGTALIGGNFHGAGPEQNAQNTTVGKAVIKANAITHGNGGTVAVWSDGNTRFAGSISAKGGAQSGNGGQVETSGHYLGVTNGATVTTAAPHGTPGDWLLDPGYIEIANAGSDSADQSFTTGDFSSSATVSPTTIEAALGGGDVTLQANYTITVTDAVSATSVNKLELDAGGSITLNAGLQNTGGTIVLYAGDPSATEGPKPGAAISGSGVLSAANIQLVLGPTGSGIGGSGSPIRIDGNPVLSIDTSAATDAPSAYIQSSSSVTIGDPGIQLDGGELQLTALGDITVNAPITTSGNQISLDATGSLVLNADITAENSSSSEGGTIVLAANDPGLNDGSGTSDTNGITGPGTLTASTIYLNVDEGPDGLSGGVGVSTAAPLHLDSALGGPISLSVGTYAGDVYLSAATGVSFDVGPQGRSIDLTAPDADPFVIANFTLTAAGPITQTYGINVNDLNLTTTGSNGVITLTDAGGSGDPGNDVSGTARFNTDAGDVSFTNADFFATRIGDSYIGGDLTVNAGAASLMLTDTAGTVSVDGNTSLSGASIGQDIAIGTHALTLMASDGDITLTNPGNAIDGVIRLRALSDGGANATITNSVWTYLGDAEVRDTLTINVTGSGAGLTLGDNQGEPVISASSISLSANGDIIQDGETPIAILTGDLTVTSTSGNIDLSYAQNDVSGTIELNANGDAAFTNSVDTVLGYSMVGGSLTVITNDGGQENSAIVIGANLDVMGTTTLHASGDIYNIDDNGETINTGALSLISDNGAIGSYENPIQTWGQSGDLVLKAVMTNGADAFLFSNSGVSIAGLGEGATAVNLHGGAFSLSALGDITVTAPITTLNNQISLDATGKILVNADITAYEPDVTAAGTILLTANDSSLNDGLGTNGTNGISGTGTLTAAYIGLSVGADADEASPTYGLGGGIHGASPGMPLTLESGQAGGTIDLAVSTYGGDVVLQAPDDAIRITSVLGLYGVDTESGSQTNPQNGGFTLSAGGSITQDEEDGNISAGALTLTAQGGDIGLEGEDNYVSGLTRLNASGYVVFENNGTTLLGASSAGAVNNDDGSAGYGTAMYIAAYTPYCDCQGPQPQAQLLIADPAGGAVQANGPVYLYADGDIVQGSAYSPGQITAGTAIPIQATDLYAETYNGDIQLNNVGNAVTGMLNLFGANVSFINNGPLAVDEVGGAGIDGGEGYGAVSLTTLSGDIALASGTGSHYIYGNTITLTAAGGITDGGSENEILANANDGAPGHVSLAAQNGGISLSSTTMDIDALFAYNEEDDPLSFTPGRLDFSATGPVTIPLIGSDPIALHGSAGGDVNISGGGAYDLYDAEDNFVSTSGGIAIDGPLVTGGALTLASGGDLTEANGGVLQVGGALDLQAYYSGIALGNSANMVSGPVTFYTSGDFLFANGKFTILGSPPDPVTGMPTGSTLAEGKITVVSAGDLTITAGNTLESDAVDEQNLSPIDAVTLVAGGNFINNAGAGALYLPGMNAAWKIYSAGPANDVFGGLNSMNTAVFGVTYPAAGLPTGNRYVFAAAPTLTVTANAASKTYGVDDSAALAAGYTIIATAPILVPGAFLPGTPSSYGGTPLVTSQGSGAGANAGIYDITVRLGSLAVSGFQIVLQGSSLIVNPATLTYTANAATRIYGAVNPTFSGAVTGFVNGDTLATATSGKLVFASAANTVSPVGSYALNGSGLSASNYVFTQAATNASALTISPATLLYVANSVTRFQGVANLVFSGTVTGFVNGDTLAATSGTLVFATDATAASPAGLYAVNGSGLSAANYIFVQASSNATALTINAAPSTPGLTGNATTVLTGFATALQAPPFTALLNTNLGNEQLLGPPAAPTGPTTPASPRRRPAPWPLTTRPRTASRRKNPFRPTQPPIRSSRASKAVEVAAGLAVAVAAW